MHLREVRPADHMFISILVATAFERPDEARLVETLRRDGDMALELVAEEEGTILGHIAFARMVLPAGWWAMAPVSVIQSRQGQGIGSEMIREGLDLCRQHHAQAVVVLGAPDYYGRFGFTRAAAHNLTTPFAPEFT